jgi:hypothetical protein
MILLFGLLCNNLANASQDCLLKEEKAALDSFMSDWRTYLFTQTYPEIRNPIFDAYKELAKLPVCENTMGFVIKPHLVDTYTGSMASESPDLESMENIYSIEGFGSHIITEWLFRDHVLPFPDELKTKNENISAETLARNLVEGQENFSGKVPKWVQNLFVFYDQQQISKAEITEALKFLIEKKIISQNNSTPILESGKFQIQESDCIAGEKYNESEKTCSLQCSNEEECKKELEEIRTKAISIWNSGNFLPNRTETKRITFDQEIIDYEVRGDKITESFRYPVSKTMQAWQDDLDKHKETWRIFAKIIPSQYRSDISYFSLGTDGISGSYAFVARDLDDTTKWYVIIDLKDTYPEGQFDYTTLKYSLIHDFAHILTLGSTQVDIDNALLSQYLSEYQYEKLFEQKAEKCNPRYMTYDGCTKKESYINLFFQEFWSQDYSEIRSINEIDDRDEFYDKSEEFYKEHKDGFVSFYSTSDPDEDIAESWTAFVLKDKPEPKTVADKKILFFYDHPEFVKLREFIRNRI